MWYRTSKLIDRQSFDEEEKIVRSDAERAIRQRLFLRGKHSPDMWEVERLVARTVVKLKDIHGTLDKIRKSQNFPSLQSAVDKAVAEIIK